MLIVVESRLRKAGLLLTGLGFVSLYFAFALREFLAYSSSTSPDVERLQKAVRLAPGNAKYHEKLGRMIFLAHNDVASAAEEYRIASNLNPHNAQYWLELASARRILDDDAGQRYALERAIEADPTTPDVAWEAANFFLVQGETDKALREFHMVVAGDPSQAPTALQLAMHVADVDTILRQVLPPVPDAYLMFIEQLTSVHDSAGAEKAWVELVRLGKPFEKYRALQYVDYLIQQKDIGRARIVWNQTAQLCGLGAYLASRDNLVVNGGFVSDILNKGFDWRYRKQGGVEVALDPTDLHEGHRSLSISFNGNGVTEAGIFQFVPVDPEATYDFSAYYKSDNLEAVGGPRFAVQDAYTNVTYFLSDDLKDAGVWRLASGHFKTSADAQLVVLRVLRVPEGGPIRGK
ncbi:MAG TPA: carbohydrate binding domain-containing protein, partial [Terriglobales bacterium]